MMLLMGHIIIETDENKNIKKKVAAENVFVAQNINRFSPLLCSENCTKSTYIYRTEIGGTRFSMMPT